MNKNILVLWGVFSLCLFVYLVRPLKDFPLPPAESLQSDEPADVETPFRRAYFTNFLREDVISYYKQELMYFPLFNFNYPPEEAQTIIRDQTRSYYLEELVEPLRQSVYVNGFVPQKDSEIIIVNDNEFYQKITIKQVNSSLISRTLVGIFVSISGFLLIFLTSDLLKKYLSLLKK